MHEWIAVPIIALNIPLVLVPTILIVKMRMRSRELEHRERMRALELGRDWPAERKLQLTAPWLAFLMGVVMPIVVFLFVMRGAHGPHHDVIMKTGALIALGGMLGGAWLAGRHFFHESQPVEKTFAKSTFDDEYDMIGHRD